jgi:hypothetical protein
MVHCPSRCPSHFPSAVPMAGSRGRDPSSRWQKARRLAGPEFADRTAYLRCSLGCLSAGFGLPGF